jgi:Tol biopolymer transport system component
VIESLTGASQTIWQQAGKSTLAAQWTPDGKDIIFGFGEFGAFVDGFATRFYAATDRADGGAQVAMIRPDGGNYREVTYGTNSNAFPSMAPDGERFVYRTFGPEGEGLRVKNLRTGVTTSLTTDYDNFPQWSPHGDLIMFTRRVKGDYEIFSIKPDGTRLRRLTASPGYNSHGAWSPDGQHIAFTSGRMGFKDEALYGNSPQSTGEIFVMRYDGAHVVQLTDNQWEDGTPAWQPKPKSP